MPYTAGYAIADITALKALTTANLVDGYALWVVSKNNWYGWNSSSSATVDDDSVIGIAEAPEVGRFLRAGFVEPESPPEPVSGHIKWYRMDSITNTGITINSIIDKSSGNNLIQVTSNPTLVTNAINGKNAANFNNCAMKHEAEIYIAKNIFVIYRNNVLNFDGYNGYISMRNLDSAKVPNSNEQNTIAGCQGTANLYSYPTTKGYIDNVEQSIVPFNDYTQGVNSGSLGNFHIIESVNNNSVSGTKNLCVGADTYGSSWYLKNTDIAEIIIYPFVLSDVERSVMYAYFKSMYDFSFL